MFENICTYGAYRNYENYTTAQSLSAGNRLKKEISPRQNGWWMRYSS